MNSIEAGKTIKIIYVKDREEGGQKAFELFKKAIEEGAKVFGLATGSTPVPLYNEIIKSDLDFSDKISINLDEYVGLPADSPKSYHYFMEKHLFQHKPFQASFIPDGLAKEAAEAERYDRIIEEYPTDVQILGIGTNAHIGFNEPGTSFVSTTRKVALWESTIESNKRYFEHAEDVPRFAYSMGIKSILKAKKIIVMAFGENKAEAVKKAIEGPVTEDIPASVLQKHPNVVWILDEEAAKLISRKE